MLLVSLSPDDVVETVKTGLALPLIEWQVLLPLLALGIAAGAAHEPLARGAIALFALTALATAEPAEDYLLAHQNELAFLVRFPVTDCVMATGAGLALLSCRRRFGGFLLPAAFASGLALGLAIGIESPGDTQTRWFAHAALLAAMAIAVAALLGRRLAAASWWTVAEKILGSWLIAAGILLVGLAMAPKPPAVPDPDSVPGDYASPPAAPTPP